MPSSSEVPLKPISSISPKLNPKLDLESNHVQKALATMQSYYTYGDEKLTCFRSNFMLRQGNVIVVFQQFMHKILNCIKVDAEGDNDPMT